ncbi:hypothetical protein A2814_00500 [Candidatus Nomurabacteria bacterium RIFCSPHIGHO2_01_FULL_38_19]|uniref:Primosomal protein N' 3' DNA-binding domain-containing protein n=1 Tax=Candidatus Nomurabacteria bacterium RIFCSPHIGHO2_01_FULL_38_19 TaxID=1801732 RepID=A0A1F6UVB0_9BACT|nr:MAG: hypothetical protein A2814_00500 [Candidatus Nomurabacteria bacterium RIFCSPHIGHO2_01_FULL_38_19]
MPNFLEKMDIKAIYHIYAKIKIRVPLEIQRTIKFNFYDYYFKISNGMKIVNVIPLTKGPLRNDLTYFTTKNIESGNVVSIFLRNKKILGLVLFSENVSDVKINIKDMNFNLKKIIEVKENSVFLKEYLESALLVSKYFVSSKNNAFASLIPGVFRENYDKIAPVKIRTSVEIENKKNLKIEKLLLQEPLEDRISIYKTLIRENFALKKSVFIVLPTENDIKTFEEYLSKGIQKFTFAVYGRLSVKKILKKFEQIISTPHPVLIISTAPFLCIPRQDIGVIILERESSDGYKMIARPHLDLRIFAELFASKINAKFISSDTLLRLETIAKQETEHCIPMHSLSFRTNFGGKIEVQKRMTKTLPFKIFSTETLKEIENMLAQKKKVFIFALRKGLATQTICRDCGEIVSCKKCSTLLVLYNLGETKKRTLVCNKCGEEAEGVATCDNCQSWNLAPLGIGTDTVYEEIRKIFSLGRSPTGEPKTKILKLDKESAKNKKTAEKIIKEFDSNSGSILIGTEMALFYLENKVALSVIASFDSLWSIPNFKMSEKILQLSISIISKTENKLIIQTKNNRDPAILAIESGNLLPFAREELEDRKKLGYPPFKRFIKIKHLGNKSETLKAKQILAEILKDYKPLIFSGFLTQVKSKYVTNALIKMETKNWSLPGLSANSSIDENLLAKLLSLPPSFEIFVDPEDLL